MEEDKDCVIGKYDCRSEYRLTKCSNVVYLQDILRIPSSKQR